ncbi:MAG TPA: matrixin family metalloprotease, partial [Planctomycetota bacterium]|nr:matrixin family metalloprotease [Planctomycetota bacterium]
GQSLSIFVNNVVLDDTVTYQGGAYRGYNTISFGINSDSRVIAVTRVWGYFSGKPSTREIIEAHIQMNDSYVWGDVVAADDSTLMDVLNILMHEVGHAAGMGDLYDTTAAEETMYGYSTEGEIKKRDLFKGDEAGITKLYN